MKPMVQTETIPPTITSPQTVSPESSSPKPVSPSRRKSRRRKANRRFGNYRGLTVELTAKLLINGLIATAAITASQQLIAYYQTQQSRLAELEQEVEKTQARVNRLNEEFARNFDPYQHDIWIKEKTNQIEPHQRRIVWLESDTDRQESP